MARSKKSKKTKKSGSSWAWPIFGAVMALSWLLGAWIGPLSARIAGGRTSAQRWLSAVLHWGALLAYLLVLGVVMDLATGVLGVPAWSAIVIVCALAISLLRRQFAVTVQNDTNRPLSVSFSDHRGTRAEFEMGPNSGVRTYVASGDSSMTLAFKDGSGASFTRTVPFRWFVPRLHVVRLAPSNEPAWDGDRPS